MTEAMDEAQRLRWVIDPTNQESIDRVASALRYAEWGNLKGPNDVPGMWEFLARRAIAALRGNAMVTDAADDPVSSPTIENQDSTSLPKTDDGESSL